MTDEAFVDREVDISLDGQSLDRLIETPCEYREERDKWSGHVYDLPTSDLPRTGGMTKAQHVWNAITLGAEAERAGLVAKAV